VRYLQQLRLIRIKHRRAGVAVRSLRQDGAGVTGREDPRWRQVNLARRLGV